MRTVRVIPCLDVDRRPGRQGRALRRPASTPATRSSWPPATTPRAPTSWSSSTSPPPPTSARPWSTWWPAPPSRSSSPSPSAAGCAASTTPARLLRAGADKVAVNTAAIDRPGAGRRAGRGVRRPVRGRRHRRPGPARRAAAGRSTPTAGAGRPGIDAVGLGRARRPALGAGEILLTSMDRDGTAGRLRPRAHAGGGRRGRRPGRRLGRRRHARAPGRGGDGRRGRRRAGRLDLPPARAHGRRGQGLPGRPRGAGPAGRRPASATGARRRPPGGAGGLATGRATDAVPCRCGTERAVAGRRAQAADHGALRPGAGPGHPGRGRAAVAGGHPDPGHRPGVAPADLGRDGGGRARTSGRSSRATRCCSTPRTASRSRSRARST